ncbi:MAG: STAS domain-containing protein [Magnetococcales bacterium]|nr:STAS domain-containing protein [Magnetococcales bacterium]
MELDGVLGSALDVNEIAVFLVFPTAQSFEVGHKGVLSFIIDHQPILEHVKVARVTKVGVALVSLEESSAFARLCTSSRSGVKYVQHDETESIVHLRGELSADFWDEFSQIYRERPPGWRYRLDFKNVTGVSPSGLAMLLDLEAHNQGGHDDIVIVHCSKEMLDALALLNVPGIGITLLGSDQEGDDLHQFQVETFREPGEPTTVKIHVARMFDYNCRNDFAKLYRYRGRHTQYILDFQDTIHIGKAAFGSMLMLNQHNREKQGEPIRMIHCSPHVKNLMHQMKFENFFVIE